MGNREKAIESADEVRACAEHIVELLKSGQPGRANDVSELEEIRSQLGVIRMRIEERE